MSNDKEVDHIDPPRTPPKMKGPIDHTSYFLQLNEEALDNEAPFAYDAENSNRSISPSQCISAVKRVAVALQSLGLQKGDCVVLYSRGDLYNWVLGDGVVAAGGVFCPLPPDQTAQQLWKTLQTANAQWVFASQKLFKTASEAAVSIGLDSRRVIMFDPPGLETDSETCQDAKQQHHFGWMLDTFDETLWSDPHLGQDPSKSTAFRFFTSGTTGLPKAANLSHTTSLARMDPPIRDDEHGMRVLHVLGQHHSTALLNWNRAASGLQKLYISPCRDVSSIVENIHRHGITDVFLHPRMLDGIAAILEADKRQAERLKSLVCITLVGDLVQNETLERCRRILPPRIMVKPRYGLTEAGAINRMPDHTAWSAGEVGFPDGVSVKIIDPQTLETVDPDTPGEICVRGPRVFDGYEGAEVATESTFLPFDDDDDDGIKWLKTGDQGIISSQNCQLKITGRYKEMFRVGGETVLPREVENILLCHPSIVDAVVTSTVSRKSREDLECLAYVVTCGTLEASDVLSFMRAESGVDHQVPTGGVVFCQKIPRNDVGKVQKNDLRDVKVLPGSMMYL